MTPNETGTSTGRLEDLIPILMCADVQKSIAFYRDVVGFEVKNRMDDVGQSGFASLQNGGAAPMLASPTHEPEAPKVDGRLPSAHYNFYADDVVALWTSIGEKGHEVSDLAVRFYGMKEFELLDPDGHVLVFEQETDEPIAGALPGGPPRRAAAGRADARRGPRCRGRRALNGVGPNVALSKSSR